MDKKMERLYKAAQELKGINSPSELAKALNESPQTITNWAKRGISSSGSIRAQAVIGCSANWILTGEGPMVTDAETIRSIESACSQRYLVPILANHASMGDGSDQNDEDVLADQIYLTERFVAELKIKQAMELRFIHAYGDSMSPTLNSGDVLLVDAGVKEVKIDGIYVLKANDRLFVKRVRQRLDGRFEISSDNPGHKTSDILDGSAEVSVVGRVVYYWNGKKVS